MSKDPQNETGAASQDNVIVLPVSLTIRELEHLHDKWLPYVDQEGDVLIDANQTQEVDGAGLQLLLSLVRDLVGRGRKVSWTGVSSSVLDAITMLGMNSALGTD